MTLHLVHGLSYWKNKEKAVQDMTGTKKRLKKMINDCFGKSPLDGHPYYNAGQRLDDVRRLHKTSKGTSEQNWEVDEITWNDLDMDQIFCESITPIVLLENRCCIRDFICWTKEKMKNRPANLRVGYST